MEAAGETCKLCLKYIQGAHMAVLDETLLGKLEFLQMDLDQSVEESNSVCKECEEKIENAFDFKSCLVNTESCLVPYVSEDKTQKVNLRVIVEKDSPSTSAGESSAEKEVCRLCKNFVDATAVISLPKILKDDSMMEVFQGHIPEMDLEVTENPVVCVSCQNSLSSFSTLITSWSIANGWNEDDDDDMKEDYDELMGQVKKESDELSDSNTNSSIGILDISDSAKKPRTAKSKNGQVDVKVKSETDEFSDSSASVSVKSKDVKKEDGEGDTEMEDLQLKNEEVDIKDEDGNIPCNESLDDIPKQLANFMETPEVEQKKLSEEYEVQNSDIVAFQTTIEENFEENHKNETFKCEKCSYITIYKHALRNHLRTHESLEECQIFKCEKCPYNTNRKSNLNRHLKIHENLDESETFKCEKYPYITKRKKYSISHLQSHQNLTECRTFQCEKCSYITKHKSNLTRHFNTHHGLKEGTSFKCYKCPFETKHKNSLTNHLKTHQTFEEYSTFKCEKCSFITKHKSNLTKHLKTHQSLKECITFKCYKCPYETKYKKCLTTHLKTHQTFEEHPTFKCGKCPFITKHKQSFKAHKKIHQSLEECSIFKCFRCLYITKDKEDLKIHLKSHEERPTFKCEKCPYETKNKSCLRRHLRIHKSL